MTTSIDARPAACLLLVFVFFLLQVHGEGHHGVRDLLVKYNLRNFNIFLQRLQGKLYEFAYCECCCCRCQRPILPRPPAPCRKYHCKPRLPL